MSADARSTSRIPDSDLFRIGGRAGIVTGAIAIVANVIHPRMSSSDLGEDEKLLDMISDFSLWRVDHLAAIIAALIGVLTFVAIARSISDAPGAAWARFAFATGIIAVALGAVAFALDGFVLAAVADDWAASSGQARAVVLERFATIEYLDIALFSTAVIALFGAAQFLYGIALYSSTGYARWIGGTALVASVLGFASGIWMAVSGELGVGNFLILFTLTSGLFAVWILGASVTLLRMSKGT